MAEIQTRPSAASVDAFIAAQPDAQRRADCQLLIELMQRATGEPAVLWGPAIVGFGTCTYPLASGRSGEMALIGFSPRKGDITVYVTPGFAGFEDLLARLGRHKTARVCLYIRRLADLDIDVLRQIVERCVARMAPRRIASKVMA
jgi:hypothetical protein